MMQQRKSTVLALLYVLQYARMCPFGDFKSNKSKKWDSYNEQRD